jgi:hypothetical protein
MALGEAIGLHNFGVEIWLDSLLGRAPEGIPDYYISEYSILSSRSSKT